jgi:hypothetical protein
MVQQLSRTSQSVPVYGIYLTFHNCSLLSSSYARVHLPMCTNLNGHGNEADFLGFLQKSVLHESLALPFEPFRFWFRICGDICNLKTTAQLPESASRRLSDSASRGSANSLTRQVRESPTLRHGESGSHRLFDSPSRGAIVR